MSKKILDKAAYEDNPWGDDAPVLGKPIKDFFPPDAFKDATITVFSKANEWSVHFSPEDANLLRKRAEETDIPPETLIAGILHNYLYDRPGY